MDFGVSQPNDVVTFLVPLVVLELLGPRDPHPSALQAAARMSVAHHYTQFSISIPKVEPIWVLGFHLAGPMDQLKLIEIAPPATEQQC